MFIGVIVELWVLIGAKVPICEGIEATPIYYFDTNACTRIAHASGALLFWKKNVQPTSAEIDCHRYSVHC